MGKKVICTLLIFASIHLYGQELDRDGLVKGTLTISPAFMLDNKSQPFYFHGILGFYTSANISFAGEGSFYLGELNENVLFSYNNSIFAGFNWHPLKNGPSDLFIGIQPGLSFTKLSQYSDQDRIGINPVTSINFGYNYFMNENFHFFVMGKTVLGKHSSYAYQSLNEFRISAGLGFSIPTKSK